QFESFVHPFVIMLTVPLGVLGALIGLAVTGGTLNLFSQIGIVMLVGLAAKNGILIVEFANQLRDAGRSVTEAIVESATVRLRPILMTSIATVAGALPLVLAGGPGSASRATIGVVIIAGVAFSTLLALFVVPAFYRLFAPWTRSPLAVAQELEKQRREVPSVGGPAWRRGGLSALWHPCVDRGESGGSGAGETWCRCFATHHWSQPLE